MKNGVPWHIAFSLEDDFRLAATIVFGEFEGNRFSYERMEWEKRE